MDETTQAQTQEQMSDSSNSSNSTEGHEQSVQKASLFDDDDENENENEAQVEQPEQPEQPTQQALTADDIKLPEGYEYDKALGDSFLGILNEAGIGKETAQKLFDLYQSQNLKMLEGLKAAEAERAKKFEADMAAEKAEWLKKCEADKEFGGQNWEASQAVIERAAKSFDGAVKIMQAYNLNTHPEIVRMFYRAGLLMGEDQSRTAGGGSKATDPAQAIFGESLKEFFKRRGD